MAECRALSAWAEAQPLTGERPATQAQIERHLEFLASTLPSKAVDDKAGKDRFAVYVTILGGFSDGAFRHMSQRVCQNLKWMPVPSECLEYLREYRAPSFDRDGVLRLCSDFADEQFERWLANLTEGQPIGDVPEQWVRIAIERGPLRRLKGGTIVSRALYHGPFKPAGMGA